MHKINIKKKTYLIILPVITLLAFYFFFVDKKKPIVETTFLPLHIGLETTLETLFFDRDAGLKKIEIFIEQNGTKYLIFKKDIPKEGFKKNEKIKYKILIKPKIIGLEDGKATLYIKASDHSLNFFFNGNKTAIKQDILIDTDSPEIEVLAQDNSINIGGSGVIIYKISEASDAGIYIGENFYPAYSGAFQDKSIYINFFAYKYDLKKKPLIYIEAKDKALNKAKININISVLGVKKKTDTIFISNRFLREELPEYDFTNLIGSSLLDKFKYVNNEIRNENDEVIMAFKENPAKELYWENSFLRMPKAKTMATFADKRSYSYKGQIIDTQTHLGIDLASTKKAPVPAANKGKIVLSQSVGIYGKTVVIDHGFGLFSTYSHLSEINVEPSQIVEKGDIIGRTGTSGIANRDHLHLKIFIHNTFVNPAEWLENKWVKTHIIEKITEVLLLKNK